MAEFIVGNSLRRLAREHRPLKHLLWWVDFAMIWLLVKLFTLLPVDTASRVGERLGTWIGSRLTHKSMIMKENMAIAFPGLEAAELDALVRRAWGRAGRTLAEYPHLETIFKDPERIEIDIREEIETYRDPSRPCVFVTAHQSNWEVTGSALARLGVPNAGLYSPPTNPYLDRMLRESRKALNSGLLPRDSAARLLVRTLSEGRSVGIVMDRRVDDGKPIPFFGRDKPSTIMPARLALKYRCDLVPIGVERLRDARFKVTFYPPVRPARRGGDLTEQAIDMTRQVHDLFETWIRENPQDWFCSKRLWPGVKIAGREQTDHDIEGQKHAA